MWPGERRLAEKLRATDGVDGRVADAMIAVRRHQFVDWRWRLNAYDDKSLPTGDGTSISQPTYIAQVISAARVQPNDDVLEVGTGSGWTAAVLGRLGRSVVSVEVVPALAASARRRLAHARNVTPILGDGDAVEGSFDVIIVMAGAPSIPESYCARLRDGGRLVIPVGEERDGTIKCMVTRVTRKGGDFVREPLFAGDWNTLTGKDGFAG